MNNLKIKKTVTLIGKISDIVGFILIFCAGMLFVLLADLELNIRSPWLFFSALFAIGSSVCLIFADKYKERPKTMYILKGVGMLLSVFFIVFIIMFLNAAYTSKYQANTEKFKLDIFAIEALFGKKMVQKFSDTCTITIIVAAIALGMQAVNVLLTALHKIDD